MLSSCLSWCVSPLKMEWTFSGGMDEWMDLVDTSANSRGSASPVHCASIHQCPSVGLGEMIERHEDLGVFFVVYLVSGWSLHFLDFVGWDEFAFPWFSWFIWVEQPWKPKIFGRKDDAAVESSFLKSSVLMKVGNDISRSYIYSNRYLHPKDTQRKKKIHKRLE